MTGRPTGGNVIRGNTVTDSGLGIMVDHGMTGRTACPWSWHGLPCALDHGHGSPHQIVGEQPQFDAIVSVSRAQLLAAFQRAFREENEGHDFWCGRHMAADEDLSWRCSCEPFVDWMLDVLHGRKP